METAELVVFITISVIIASMIYAFAVRTGLEVSLEEEEEPALKKIDSEGFAAYAARFWEACGMGEINLTAAVFVSGDTELNKTGIFFNVKKANLCNTLQSRSNGCGRFEHMEMNSSIILPRVVRLHCDSSTQKLIVS